MNAEGQGHLDERRTYGITRFENMTLISGSDLLEEAAVEQPDEAEEEPDEQPQRAGARRWGPSRRPG
jgi:hypothetical protein